MFFGVFVSAVVVGTAYDLTHSIKDGRKNLDWKRKTKRPFIDWWVGG
jgi:hypothetical protein